MDLNGRVIAITGASRGLRAGMATWFAAQGTSLALCARTESAAPQGVECVTGGIDVTEPGAVGGGPLRSARGADHRRGRRVDQQRRVLEPVVSQRQLSAAALAEHFDINVGGVLSGTQAYLHTLDEQDRTGVSINVGSGASLAGPAGWSAYCAGKAAVDRSTETVAIDEVRVKPRTGGAA